MRILALETCPENARGFRAFLEGLAAKGELPPRHLSASMLHRVCRKDRGPNGRPLCSWCWTEVPPRRQSWCGDDCAGEFLLRAGGGAIPSQVFQRDRGVCAICGADAEKTRRVMCALRYGPDRTRLPGYDPTIEAIRLVYAAWGRCAPFNLYGQGVLWEADHIIPVWKGGGCTGAENFRTLCRPCHVVVTREQAAERAAARRAQKAIRFEDESEGGPVAAGTPS